MAKQKGIKYDIFNNFLILKSIRRAITEYIYAIIGWCYLIDSTTKWHACVKVEKGTQHIAVLHDPERFQMGHTSNFMMTLRYGTHILQLFTREMGKLNTHSPIHFQTEKKRQLTSSWKHTCDRKYLTIILEFQYLKIGLHSDDNGVVKCVCKRIRPSCHWVLNLWHTS